MFIPQVFVVDGPAQKDIENSSDLLLAPPVLRCCWCVQKQAASFSSLGTLRAPSPAPRHIFVRAQLGALALLFRLWGPKLPFLTLQHSFILSCLKAMLEKCHLLVLVEISCTFHFEYNLGERFAEHYLT